jgi:L,D-transpeptidase YcbB
MVKPIQLIPKYMQLRTIIKFTLTVIVLFGSAACRKAVLRYSEREIVSVVGQLELDSVDLHKNIANISPNAVSLQELLHLYQLNGYRSLWIEPSGLNSLGTELVAIIKNAYALGLNPYHYPIPAVNSNELDNLQEVARWDAQLTLSATMLFSHATYGIVRTNSIFSDEHHAFFRFRVMDALRTAMESGSVAKALLQSEPQFAQYVRLRTVASTIALPIYKPLTVQGFEFNRCDSALVSTLRWIGYDIDNDLVGEIGMAVVLKSYQRQHQLPLTGKYDVATFAQLSNDVITKYQLVRLNLERLRQNPPLLANYVWVNIPAYKLDLVKGNQIVHTTRVVVGAPKTPTPILSSKLTHVITYPRWNIPTSIIQKEIMPAMAKDSNYLAKKGYTVSTWTGSDLPDNTVMKYSTGANHLPFNISQPPGNDNALGTLKFLFDNSESVYLHDTNARSYFSRNFRALSHGCIRVQDPHYLATMLLDTASSARMDKQLGNKQSGHIKVNAEIGVYLRYATCGIDKNGKLEVYNDVYRYDEADRAKMEEVLGL